MTEADAVAEVDDFDEVVEVGVAMGAGLDEADAGVETFGQRVRQLMHHGVNDAVGVVVDAAGESDEAGDPATFRGGDPLFEMGRGVGGFGGAVEVAELFFQLPGSPNSAVPDAELGNDCAAGVVEVLGAGAQDGMDFCARSGPG